MAQLLESILINLMQPDNAVIQQATAQLKEAFKDPSVLLALCEVLTGSQNPQEQYHQRRQAVKLPHYKQQDHHSYAMKDPSPSIPLKE